VGPLRVEDEAVQVQLRREAVELESATELLRFRGTQDARLQRYSELELHHRPSTDPLDHYPLNLRVDDARRRAEGSVAHREETCVSVVERREPSGASLPPSKIYKRTSGNG
jgi:hypothetical protein